MIAHLSGNVLSTQERTLILQVQGVGYLVSVPRGLLGKLVIGQKLELHVHTNVREDDISLYGFPSLQEWQFFRLLLSVSGVGPKSALEILNAPMNRVQQAIAKKDIAYLTQIQGIGRKTAERITVDLQGKVTAELLNQSTDEAPRGHDDIIQALISLGYHRHQVLEVLKKIPTEIAGDEAIIKYFLQNI